MTVAFSTATPLILRSTSHQSLHPLQRRTSRTSVSRTSRMQLRSLLNAVFGGGGGGAGSGDPDKHAVLGTKIATPEQATTGVETATFGLG